MRILHGIKVNEPLTGIRELLAVSTAIIGLVAVADDADAQAFPLDTPVLVTDIRDAIAKAGETGTLAPSLAAIADQTTPVMVVVRVAEGADAAETEANLVGDAGDLTGVFALLGSESTLGVRPRILGVPGLDTQAVTTAMVTVAQQLRGFVYASCDSPADIAAAVLYRDNFAARELMLIHPDFTGFAGHAIAAALGLRAKIDEAVGPQKTLSNFAVNGIVGISEPIFFDLQDQSTTAGVLNDAPVTTLIRANGFRFWGNRTTSDEPLFAFESTVRMGHVIRDTIAEGLIWAIDKPLNPQLARDIIETINAEFRDLAARGWIIGAEALPIDPNVNTAAALAAGQLTIDYQWTAPAPLEGLTLNQVITDKYYADFADQVARL